MIWCVIMSSIVSRIYHTSYTVVLRQWSEQILANSMLALNLLVFPQSPTPKARHKNREQNKVMTNTCLTEAWINLTPRNCSIISTAPSCSFIWFSLMNRIGQTVSTGWSSVCTRITASAGSVRLVPPVWPFKAQDRYRRLLLEMIPTKPGKCAQMC